MHITSITMKGFLGFQEETHVDLGTGIIAFSGPNGSGKTSVQQAIQWCLTGVTRVSGDTDSIINHNSDRARVSIEFTHNKDTYRVTRTRMRSGNSSGQVILKAEKKATSKWIDISSGRSTTALQEHLLNNVIGASPDVLQALMFVDQSGVGNHFTGAKSEDRRAILISMLPELDRWSSIYKSVSEAFTTVNKSITQYSSALDNHLETVKDLEKDVEKLNQDAEMVDIEAIQKSIDLATDNIHSLSSGTDQMDVLRERLSAAQETRKAQEKLLEDEKERIKDRHNILWEITQQAEALSLEHDELMDSKVNSDIHCDAIRGQINSLETRVRELERKTKIDYDSWKDSQQATAMSRNELTKMEARVKSLENSDSGVCDTCHSALSDKQVEWMIQQSHDDIDSLKKIISENMDNEVHQKSLYENSVNDYENSKRSLDEHYHQLQEHESRKSIAEAKISALPERFQDLADQVQDVIDDHCEPMKIIETCEPIMDVLSKEYKSFSTTIAPSDIENEILEMMNQERGDDSLQKAREAKERASQELSRAQSILASRDALEAKLSTMRERTKAMTKNLSDAESRLKKISVLREATSPKGVPSAIISNLLGDISTHANSMLSRMESGKSMQIEFSMERAKKKGGSKPVLDILVHMDDGVRPIEAVSGGEHATITVTIMLAMTTVINRSVPGLVENLFFDEAFAAVDSDKIPQVVEMIGEAMQANSAEATSIKTMVIVTHDNKVLEGVDSTLSFTHGSQPVWK